MSFELKETSIRNAIQVSVFCFRNAVHEWTFYACSSAVDLAQMLVNATVFFFMALYVGPAAGAHVAEFGGNYAGYILIGFLTAGLLGGLMRSFYEAVASGYWGAQLEFYGSFPRGIHAYLAGSAAFQLLAALIRFLVVLLVGVTVFRLSVAWGNWGSAAVVLLVGMLPVLGLALAAASTFYLLDAKGWRDPVSWLTEILASLVAGVYFPPDLLPAALRELAPLLPHYHILRALRLAVMTGAGLSDPVVAHDIAALLVMGLVLVPLGGWLFALGLRRASRLGQFTRWV
jgi:ABC-2 type transport system permease protein